MKDVVYSRTAQKALMRMLRNWANRIRDKISAYAEDPGSQANNVRPLKGLEGVMRLRVGNWRILMRDEVVLLILDVKACGSAYKE